MKILIISSETLNPNNTYASIFELAQARALKNQHTEIAIISVHESLSIVFTIKSLLKAFFKDFLRLKFIKFFKKSNQILKNLNVLSKTKSYIINGTPVFEGVFMSKSIKQNSIEYIDLWTNKGYNAFEVYLKKYGKPDIIHAHSRFILAGVLALKIKENTGIPYVITEHSSFYYRVLKEDKIQQRFYAQFVEDVFLNSKANIFVSVALKELVFELYPKINSSKAYIVPNVLGEDFCSPFIQKTISTDSAINIVSIGSLDNNKNQQLILKALIDLNNNTSYKFHVKIIGSGNNKEKLNQMIFDERIKNVKIVNSLTPLEIVNVIDESHILVHTSKYETFGVVIIESLGRGRPVISTKSYGPESIITPENGILIDFNAEDLKKKLIDMINTYDKYDQKKISYNTQFEYGTANIAEKLLKIYNNKYQ